MANYIEGPMKVRGPYENVKRFFLEGIEHLVEVKDLHYEPYVGPQSDWVHIYEDEYEAIITYRITPPSYLYFKETQRAFPSEYSTWEVHIIRREGKEAIGIADVRQAWSWVSEDWESLAKKYNVDIRLHGWESGTPFEYMVEALRDGTVNEESKEYDDWLYECPNPFMGG